MWSNNMKHLSTLLSLAAMFMCSEAGIRGSNHGREGRELDGNYYQNRQYNNYYNNNNNNRNANNYYNNNNNNRNNYYRYYNKNNNYNNNNNNNNYNNNNNNNNNNNDDVDDVYAVTDDNLTNSTNDSSLSATISNMENQAMESFSSWYQSSPGDWTSQQWGFLAGLTLVVGGLIVCFVKCCCACCCGRNEYDSFDEYVAMDSKRHLKGVQSESTDIDDDATFDQVMRLRSLD